MQYGPGAENAFSGVATAYSDSVPMLVLPLGHPTERAGAVRYFNSTRAYGQVTKSAEEVNSGSRVSDIMRRAFSQLKMGRPGPVMVEVPCGRSPTRGGRVGLSLRAGKVHLRRRRPADIDEAARVLVEARCPLIHAGQGVLYAEATQELVNLAELLQAPVMTTLVGKSAFPEDHPLSLGTGSGTMTGPVVHFMRKADVVLGIGCSFSRHGMNTPIPAGKVMIQATNDATDINQDYNVDYPILGDAPAGTGPAHRSCKRPLG